MEDQRYWPDQCIRRPALDDLDLIAAIDGEANDEILAHLAECPHCAERARDLESMQQLLRQRLYRILCPSTTEMLSYQQGWLEQSRQIQLRAHLEECPHCSGEMRLLAEAANAPPFGEVLLGSLRRVVAVALMPRGRPTLAPIYGGLRGGRLGAHYAYRAENMQLTLNVQRAVGRSGQVVLVGMLIDEDGMVQEFGASTASLLREEWVITSSTIDELGNFVLEDIIPGNYSLSLRLPDREVVVEALSL
jgi:hypothetical protein